MNGNFMGMDTDLAKVAMDKIKSKKTELDTESKNSSASLREKTSLAFAGEQVNAMQDFIDRINAALEKLYTVLDGSESNFAQKFEEVISSYVDSDKIVQDSFAKSQVE